MGAEPGGDVWVGWVEWGVGEGMVFLRADFWVRVLSDGGVWGGVGLGLPKETVRLAPFLMQACSVF